MRTVVLLLTALWLASDEAFVSLGPRVWSRRLLAEGGRGDPDEAASAPLHTRSRPLAPGKTAQSLAQASVSASAALAALLLRPRNSRAEADVKRRAEAFLNDPSLQKAEVNLQSDDFWYPPFLLGRWNASLLFDSAKFVGGIPVETLAREGRLPGFAKYSVFFLPEMGVDIPAVQLRYVSLDGHPREDHPHNLRSLVQTSAPETVVDAAPYSFQKAPNWLSSPANRWRVRYHDGQGRGVVDFLTQKRNLRIFAGTVESAEFIRQTHWRAERRGATNSTSTNNGTSGGGWLDPSSWAAERAGDPLSFAPVVTDYCLNWRLTVPASLRDEFITVEDLRRTETVLGALDVYVYLQPTSDLYLQRPGRPAGVFSYNVTMRRPEGWTQGAAERETEDTTYPFVWRDAGPVELDKYFGH